MEQPRDNSPPPSPFAPWRWNRMTWFRAGIFLVPLWLVLAVVAWPTTELIWRNIKFNVEDVFAWLK